MKQGKNIVVEENTKELAEQQKKPMLTQDFLEEIQDVDTTEKKANSNYEEQHRVTLDQMEMKLEERLKTSMGERKNLLGVLQKKPFLEKYRCTYLGSDMVEERIKADMFYISNYVEKYFQEKDIYALILGGSYGLGEGGVKIHNYVEKAFNDYDIFVFVNEKSFLNYARTKLFFYKASKFLTKKLGIRVDFSYAFPKNFLSRFPIALRWYDLQEGHKVILGPPDALSRFAHIDAKSLPIQEAFQLMLNRGVGILQVKEDLESKKMKDYDVIKNLYKGILAIGDSFLLVNGHYRVQVLHRCNILKFYAKESEFIQKLFPFYEKAMRFRFLPLVKNVDIPLLFEKTLELFQLFYFPLFSLYYGKPVKNLKGLYSIIQENPVVDYRGSLTLKNILLNLIYVGDKNVFSSWVKSYPANRLFVLLPFFLFESKMETVEKNIFLPYVDKLLNVYLTDQEKDMANKIRLKKFFDIWGRFN